MENIDRLWPFNKPDFNRLRCVMFRQGLPDRVPFIELGVDGEIVNAVLGVSPFKFDPQIPEHREELMRRVINYSLKIGYDYIWAHPVVNLPTKRLGAQDTAALPHEQRMWVNEYEGVIANWEDFERYPWPLPESIDYSYVEFMAKNVPEGMQVITGTSGILEWVMWLMGFVPFSMAIYEQPDLVEAMFERIGTLFEVIYQNLVDIPNVGAIVLADDMGYKSGTFIKPDQMRQYVFPRQRRLGEIAHAKRLPFFMHACGNLKLIMEDLIEDVRIDGKHSFEDSYLSAVDAKRLYGDRIAILGGVDMDIISRSSEAEVRAYTRRLLEACMPGGGFALGTGNTVANYIPVHNYVAMLDEGMKYGYY